MSPLSHFIDPATPHGFNTKSGCFESDDDDDAL